LQLGPSRLEFGIDQPVLDVLHVLIRLKMTGPICNETPSAQA
jgi:hypothetical protein